MYNVPSEDCFAVYDFFNILTVSLQTTRALRAVLYIVVGHECPMFIDGRSTQTTALLSKHFLSLDHIQSFVDSIL